MNVQIDEMAWVEDNRYRYVLRYGDQTLEGEVEVSFHDAGEVPLRALDLRPGAGYDLMNFVSAHSDFAKDFWAFVDGRPRPSPWSYGPLSEEHLKKAVDFHQL